MRKIFTNDTAFKVYSVLIAILLWAFVVYNQNPESTKAVTGISVYYTNADALENAGLVIVQDKAPTLDITIKGKRLSIGKVDRNNVTASVTIPEMQAGEYDIAIDTRLPLSDVAITDKNPYNLHVVVDRIKRVDFPIEVKQSGASRENVSVHSAASPETIALWGPESIINQIETVQVSVDLNGVTTDVQEQMQYKIISANGEDMTDNVNIRRESDTVSVVSTIYETRDIPITVSYLNNPPENYSIAGYTISPSTVRLGSRDSAIASLSEIRTEPIDVSQLTESQKITARLDIPSEYVNIFSLREVEINFEVEEIITRTVSIENITYQNAENARQYTVNSLPVSVEIRGPASLLENPQIVASVDVSGAAAGSNLLPLDIDVPDGIQVVGEYTVELLVSE